ncbi:single-stranded DNA-binding related protein [Cyclospora cayetanensis]|uniref:Single-stranded DNA-binding related protein n=1 Tax=Cyclospora cayetanensis TaxID=88456 RepID=A0A1D3CS72_9EIME|nr:single-stranded DNA-binding related protein [Cyclospora cayetanensis]
MPFLPLHTEHYVLEAPCAQHPPEEAFHHTQVQGGICPAPRPQPPGRRSSHGTAKASPYSYGRKQAERSVNRVTLIGRVGLDPEVRHLLSGDRMASFSLATSEQWRDKATGEVRSRTEWHRVVVFDKALVNLVEAFVHKGRRLYVDGSLQTRRWVASDGQERYTTEVLLSKYKGELVLLESPEDKHAGASTHRASSPDIAQGGGMARIAGSSQASRSNGGSSEDFESQHESPGATGARNAVAPRGEAGTGVRFNASWR